MPMVMELKLTELDELIEFVNQVETQFPEIDRLILEQDGGETVVKIPTTKPLSEDSFGVSQGVYRNITDYGM